MISLKRASLAFGAVVVVAVVVGFAAFPVTDVPACVEVARQGFRPIADARDQRFLGKVQDYTGECRGPEERVEPGRATPWVDWAGYWATGDEASRAGLSLIPRLGRNGRGIDGALLDLEYQRIELIKFNLFDNYTFREYAAGRDGRRGAALTTWSEMRLPPGHPNYGEVGGAGAQACRGELIRHRTLTGICNDVFNPAMGSSGMLFARNVQFEQTFPDISSDPYARARHGGRISLLHPDPQLISRELFTRRQSDPTACNRGQGMPDASPMASCDYQAAPFFNVLAAFWIQFMTHDWFSHMQEGRNASEQMPMGCAARGTAADARALSAEEIARLGCRPGDRIDRALVADDSPPPTFTAPGSSAPQLARAYRTTRNNVTAWWDASQIYGYDEVSARRVKRDPMDRARLLLVNERGQSDARGYLPVLGAGDPHNPEWSGQEAVAFPDNWSLGMSFYHNLFVREHNAFVDAFRRMARSAPQEDSGLRDPANPQRVIRNADVTPDELFEAARLVVAAEIAKIHTTEWTTQLLYDEVLYRGMNANWHGLFREKESLKRITAKLADEMSASESEEDRTLWFSVFASGSGIFGLGSKRPETKGPLGLLGSKRDTWNVENLEHVNGGVNHFGSPFNFPEEFITAYRLHPLVPDLLEFREHTDPNAIRRKVPVISTFRGGATPAMREGGLANWALSMGRQRLGLLTLNNHPQFLQNLPMPRLASETNLLDVPALDIVRDRERGVPRFNEFRRQYGLQQLTSFDDFVDRRLAADAPERVRQQQLAAKLREIYGQHRCDASKVITAAQRNADGSPINDCLGAPDGTLVDNVEDLDVIVGFFAESTRPHGFAISETQFTVFILNASRRLFSDRFFTSSFRPEFYTQFGVDWVNQNGPEPMLERTRRNGHREEVSPLKRILLRTMPELAPELEHVGNVFDPWARDRGSYYSIEWKPRRGAEADPAFAAKR